uniref:Transposon MuDR mudrA n=1 Tax=Solanum tuberosum TaxID=4113 RepID=M1DCK3_SOLTU
MEHSDGSDYEWDLSEGEEYDYEWMEAISKEMGRVVGDRCLISRDGKTEGFKIKTFINNHACEEAFFNARADIVTLAQYFKNKLQNNPKYKVKDMKGELENDLKLNVCHSKLKRAKKMALEKLEGSFMDDYNKIEAYAQELKQSNPGSDALINISKDTLAEGKRKILGIYRD